MHLGVSADMEIHPILSFLLWHAMCCHCCGESRNFNELNYSEFDPEVLTNTGPVLTLSIVLSHLYHILITPWTKGSFVIVFHKDCINMINKTF